MCFYIAHFHVLCKHYKKSSDLNGIFFFESALINIKTKRAIG